jgi:protoporphyrinogen IX oxidase
MILIIKALHIISFTCWMAGMFYLPRLFVYHADAAKGSELSETLKVMERKLLKFIMNPAMISTWVFGIWLVMLTGAGAPGTGYWMQAKFLLVLILSGLHGMFSAGVKRFSRDENTKSARAYRWLNEAPTAVFLGIVLLVVLKPF